MSNSLSVLDKISIFKIQFYSWVVCVIALFAFLSVQYELRVVIFSFLALIFGALVTYVLTARAIPFIKPFSKWSSKSNATNKAIEKAGLSRAQINEFEKNTVFKLYAFLTFLPSIFTIFVIVKSYGGTMSGDTLIVYTLVSGLIMAGMLADYGREVNIA